MSGQRGQAIVGVLVVMTLVFVLAGAVAIGASTLLTRLRGPATAVENDLTVQSAAAAAAAAALNGRTTGACTPQTPGQAQQTVTPTPATFSLPAPNGGRASTQRTYCVALQQAAGAVEQHGVVAPPAGSCTKTGIGSPTSSKTDLWIFFAAHWLRSGGTYSGGAYVAPVSDACRGTAVPGDRLCSTVIRNAADPVVPLAMSCPIRTGAALFVYGAIANFTAYLAAQDRAGGSYYLATAGTGQGYEQVLLFQPASAGSSPQLRFEGVLP